jgi:hypothetical protein
LLPGRIRRGLRVIMSNLIYMEKENLAEVLTEILHDKFDEIRLANPPPREVMTLAETAEYFRVHQLDKGQRKPVSGALLRQ